jgi:hypothetical protein
LNAQATIEDDRKKARYFPIRFKALELAVRLDAGREDLWNVFLVQVSNILSPVIHDKGKGSGKRGNARRSKEVVTNHNEPS